MAAGTTTLASARGAPEGRSGYVPVTKVPRRLTPGDRVRDPVGRACRDHVHPSVEPVETTCTRRSSWVETTGTRRSSWVETTATRRSSLSRPRAPVGRAWSRPRAPVGRAGSRPRPPVGRACRDHGHPSVELGRDHGVEVLGTSPGLDTPDTASQAQPWARSTWPRDAVTSFLGHRCASHQSSSASISGVSEASVSGMPSSSARLSAIASSRRIRPAMASLVSTGSCS